VRGENIFRGSKRKRGSPGVGETEGRRRGCRGGRAVGGGGEWVEREKLLPVIKDKKCQHGGAPLSLK